MNTSTTNYFSTIPTEEEKRKIIIDRLYKAGHINLDEVILLASPAVEYQYLPYNNPILGGPYHYANPGILNGDKTVIGDITTGIPFTYTTP